MNKQEILNLNKEDLLKFYNENFEQIRKVLYEDKELLGRIIAEMVK